MNPFKIGMALVGVEYTLHSWRPSVPQLCYPSIFDQRLLCIDSKMAMNAATLQCAQPYLISRNRLEKRMNIDYARRRVVNQDLKSKAQCEEEAVHLLSILNSELGQVRTEARQMVKAIMIRAAQENGISVANGRQVSKIRDLTDAWKNNHNDKGMAERMWRCLYGVKDNTISSYEMETDIMHRLGWAYICGESAGSEWPCSNGCVAPFVTEAFNMIRKLVLNPGKIIHGWTICIAANRSTEGVDKQASKYIRRTKCVFDAARFLKHKGAKSLAMFEGVCSVAVVMVGPVGYSVQKYCSHQPPLQFLSTNSSLMLTGMPVWLLLPPNDKARYVSFYGDGVFTSIQDQLIIDFLG